MKQELLKLRMLAWEMKSKTEGEHNLSIKFQVQIFSTSQRKLQNTGEGKILTGENAKWMQETNWKLGVDRAPAEIQFLEGILVRTLNEEEKITTVKLAVPPTIVTLIYTIVRLILDHETFGEIYRIDIYPGIAACKPLDIEIA